MKKVLIAHQSTIPHYRIPFYNALEKMKPDNWSFAVVFDPGELKNPQFFKEQLDTSQFKFPILSVNTIGVKIAGKNITYQTFWRRAAKYDLIIVEQALNNLAYPFCQLYQLTKSKFAYWGHGKHIGVENPSFTKSLSENLKILLTRKANGFFAYTSGVKSYLLDQGVSSNKVFVLNNTIDIKAQRNSFEKLRDQKEEIKQSLGLEGKKVLLFVGRFCKNKRINFLLEAFSVLYQQDPSFHLLLVGSDGEEYLDQQQPNISYFGAVTDLDKLAPIYVAADIFSFPGFVGLGPVQALCYDLPIVTISSNRHKPEIEYLSPQNSIVMASNTTPEKYACQITELFNNVNQLQELQANAWSSIEHLTIERMAQNFIEGVNSMI